MKKLLAFIAALAFTAAMQADDFSLYYDTADGAANELGAVASIQKIVFSPDATMTVVKTDGTKQKVAVSVVKRLYFSTAEALSIAATESSTPEEASSIHDIMGRKMNAQSVSQLPKGMYIIDGKKIAVQ